MLEFTLFPFQSVSAVESQTVTLYNKINHKNYSRLQPIFMEVSRPRLY
jgi:hypothetical protein